MPINARRIKKKCVAVVVDWSKQMCFMCMKKQIYLVGFCGPFVLQIIEMSTPRVVEAKPDQTHQWIFKLDQGRAWRSFNIIDHGRKSVFQQIMSMQAKI